MKVIVYAGAELLTGDDIAIGVLRYCEALAGSVAAEVIEIPVREADGSLGLATLLVGPTSQLVARNVKSELEDVVDPDVMRQLHQRTKAQRSVASSPRPWNTTPGHRDIRRVASGVLESAAATDALSQPARGVSWKTGIRRSVFSR